MTYKVLAWLDESDSNLIKLLGEMLVDNPQYKFAVVEDVLCIVRNNRVPIKPISTWTTGNQVLNTFTP